jgi:uncharacterized protein with GYD domain
MIDNPGDRATAVHRVIESLNGSLECLYWMLGTHDGIGIAQLPDSAHAAALSTMITSTGAFKTVQTQELLTHEQLGRTHLPPPRMRRLPRSQELVGAEGNAPGADDVPGGPSGAGHGTGQVIGGEVVDGEAARTPGGSGPGLMTACWSAGAASAARRDGLRPLPTEPGPESPVGQLSRETGQASTHRGSVQLRIP